MIFFQEHLSNFFLFALKVKQVVKPLRNLPTKSYNKPKRDSQDSRSSLEPKKENRFVVTESTFWGSTPWGDSHIRRMVVLRCIKIPFCGRGLFFSPLRGTNSKTEHNAEYPKRYCKSTYCGPFEAKHTKRFDKHPCPFYMGVLFPISWHQPLSSTVVPRFWSSVIQKILVHHFHYLVWDVFKSNKLSSERIIQHFMVLYYGRTNWTLPS